MTEILLHHVRDTGKRIGDGDDVRAYEILHGRTGFDDGDAEHGRHLLRLWLTHPRGRPLPPELAATRELHWSYAARHAGGAARL